MNDILDIELILNRKKYSYIYCSLFVFLFIIFVFALVTIFYDIDDYYVFKAKFFNNSLELMVLEDDIDYIYSNSLLTINDINYTYVVKSIDDEYYVDNFNNVYKYVYIDVLGTTFFENLVYEVKIFKEKKKIIEYLKEEIWN